MDAYIGPSACLRLARSKHGCNAGLQEAADDEYTLAISVLGIVAVLIANITYLGYITPPGGTHPSWEACDYKVFIAFFVLNGLAFIFSLCAIWLMIFMPLQWLVRGKAEILGHKTVVWWGAAMVGFAMLCLLAAFTAAGLVSVGFGAPDYTCGILTCEAGGVYCTRHTYARESRSLNKYKGRCYQVYRVASGAYIKEQTLTRTPYNSTTAYAELAGDREFDISFPGQRLLGGDGPDQTFHADVDNDTCYFWGNEVLSGFDDSNFRVTNTLCMVPSAFPDGADARGGFAFDLFSVLAKEATSSQSDRVIWYVKYNEGDDTVFPGNPSASVPGLSHTNYAWVVPASPAINRTICDLVEFQNGNFSFFSSSSSVYIIDRLNGVENYDYWNDTKRSIKYSTATFADAASVVVHEELPYRCETIDEASGDATWCRYIPDNQTHHFDGAVYKSTPRCPSDHNNCTRLAVEADGSYIQLSNLARLVGDGNHVLPPPSETLTTVEKAVFSILGIGLAVNIGILVWFMHLVGFLPWLNDLRRVHNQECGLKDK